MVSVLSLLPFAESRLRFESTCMSLRGGRSPSVGTVEMVWKLELLPTAAGIPVGSATISVVRWEKSNPFGSRRIARDIRQSKESLREKNRLVGYC